MSTFRAAWALSLVAAPIAVSIYGWASHWNAYTNLLLTLSSAVLWLVTYTALRPGS